MAMTKDQLDKMYARADALNLNDEMKCRLWFMSYDDLHFIEHFIAAPDDEIPHLLSALDYDIKAYSSVEYLKSKEAGEYIPPYDDRRQCVLTMYDAATPEEREERMHKLDFIESHKAIEVGNWYADDASTE